MNEFLNEDGDGDQQLKFDFFGKSGSKNAPQKQLSGDDISNLRVNGIKEDNDVMV